MKTKIKNGFATVVAICLIANYNFAQTTSLIWSSHYTGSSLAEYTKDVHVGGDGRVYACGAYGPNLGNAMVISYNPATGAINSGWPVFYNGSTGGPDVFNALTTYGSGTSTKIYAAGFSAETGNANDMLLMKYNFGGGTPAWTITWHNNSNDYANCVKVEASGNNVYVCGRTSSNNGDLFVRKYTSTGAFVWGTIYDSPGSYDDIPQFMEINGAFLYITSIRSISATNHDAVLQKIKLTDGSITWTSVWGGSNIDETYWLDFDGNKNIYTVGTTQTSSNYDVLVLKYDSTGAAQCSTVWNSPNNYDDKLASVDVVYPSNNPVVYATGYTQINPTNNDADYLTIKVDGTQCGTPTWTKTLDGSGTGCPTTNDDYGYQVMVSPTTGKVYVSGRSYETSGGMNATTVCYSDNGSTVSEDYRNSFDRNSTDNGPGASDTKYPLELQYDGCHAWDHIYVTGYSHEGGTGTQIDATTLKYSRTDACSEGPEGGRMAGQAEGPMFLPIISPNPFTGKAIFSLGIEVEIYIDAEFHIYDITGREVKRIETQGTTEFEIDMTGFEEGLFFYKFAKAERIIATGKFIIIR